MASKVVEADAGIHSLSMAVAVSELGGWECQPGLTERPDRSFSL